MSRAHDRLESHLSDSHSLQKQRNLSITSSNLSKPENTPTTSKASRRSLQEYRKTANTSKESRATPREEDGTSPSDVLNTGGSASSLSSTASSIFSTNQSVFAQNGSRGNMNTLTPLTHSESSPPGKMGSPHSQKRTYDDMQNTASNSPYLAPVATPRAVSETITPAQTPPEPNLQARPCSGEVKGYKITLDPETLPKKDRKNLKPTYREFGAEVRSTSMQVYLLT